MKEQRLVQLEQGAREGRAQDGAGEVGRGQTWKRLVISWDMKKQSVRGVLTRAVNFVFPEDLSGCCVERRLDAGPAVEGREIS